jgi:hypothetical protein
MRVKFKIFKMQKLECSFRAKFPGVVSAWGLAPDRNHAVEIPG